MDYQNTETGEVGGMPDSKGHCVIIGAGVVGAYIGAHLWRQGQAVSFVVRPERCKALREEGIVLELNKETVAIPPQDMAFAGEAANCPEGGHAALQDGKALVTTEPETLPEADYVFLCVPSDKLAGAWAAADPFRNSRAEAVVCCPLWEVSVPRIPGGFAGLQYVLPGISGVWEDGQIYGRSGKTAVGPLANTAVEQTHALAELLRGAGIRASVDPALLTHVQGMLAVGMPFLLGVGVAGYALEAFTGDRALVRQTAEAQRSAVRILERMEAPLGLPGHAVKRLPTGLLASLYRAMPYFVRGLSRRMIEVHFKKVHTQTVYLMQQLLDAEPEPGPHSDPLRDLLKRCSSA
ncbi:MAG: 2-dehydropantoate 2-reductase N-terminal domain-containing protein [Candidatus Hydrogenedentota bacterium]